MAGPVTGLAYYNQAMVSMAEHWDDFMLSRTLKQPNIWHDRIPRSSYKLFNGLVQKTNVFRGALNRQGGLSTWEEIGTSNKSTGFDNCNPGTPSRYSIAIETMQHKGYQDHWQSDPLCVNDLKFQDAAKEQVALNVKAGVDYGISMLENFNREQYTLQALQSSRGMIMASGALEFEDNSTYRFDYDPFSTVTDVDGDSVTYITYDPTLEISTLNWEYIDYIRFSLAQRAGEAALGMVGGMPTFGLMIDVMDFERMIKGDSELRQDWRDARPEQLIKGYDMGLKTYRGMAIIHDPRQMRFRPHSLDTAGNLIATRVLPKRLGRQVTIGRVPEPNPDYYRAEIGVGVIFMNDVLQNLFVPSIDNLGSGMTFGPMPGLTGQWQWINIRDNSTNRLGETGYFYGRFQLFPKPLLHANDCTVFIYKRCPHALSTPCIIESNDAVGSSATTLAEAAVTGDFDDTNNRVTVTLSALLAAGVGDAVTVAKAGGDKFAARILEDGDAPKYVLGWVEGASNEPTAYTDFTVAATVTA